ncbi:MAG TPA: CapA family protein [Chloroflexota bacterium]|nr:CapA family protein [Chloroflexota bacterium]
MLKRLMFVLNSGVLVISLMACASQPAESVELASVQVTAVPPTMVNDQLPIANSPTPILTSTPTPAPSATATPTPTASPTATPTPDPPIIVAAAAEWETAVTTALAELTTEQQPWQFHRSDDPTADLAAGLAHVAVSHDPEGALIFQEPLALAIPFTTNWQFITLADAQAILENGHQIVIVLPWHEMTPDLKALHVNGIRPNQPEYPLQTQLTLTAVPGMETAVSQLLPLLQTALQPASVIQITAVGDIMMDRGLGYNLRQGYLTYPFAKVAHLFHAADITVGNVESALGTGGEPMPKAYPFRAPPEAAEALALAGFDVVSLANNHGMDYGEETLLEGIELLKAAGVQPIGAGANRAEARTPYITEANGLTVAFLGYVNVPVEARSAFDVRTWDATETSPGLAWGEPDVVTEDVTAVRPQVDLVVVVLHSGFEYVEEPSEPQAAIARAAIDAGADIVIGHHAHILQGIEFYNGGVIVYGLGNFAFEIDGDPSTAILNVWLDANGVREIELIPAIIQFGGQPRLIEAWESFPALERVYYLTKILNGR